ncbi:MAG: stalk domain-containing protein [Thermovenabulum sp.]|uniref:copper amine oxidase N-terminal domain-containing protein n=1 Tax=Thermovenabulum sp. TaxID=3100335 RepID=UPI003C7A48E3
MLTKKFLKVMAVALIFTLIATTVALAAQPNKIKDKPIKERIRTEAKTVQANKGEDKTIKERQQITQKTTNKANIENLKMQVRNLEQQVKMLKEQIKEMKGAVKVNGKQLKFDVPPVIKNGRVLIPLRAVMNGFKADVSYDKDTNTVIIKKGDKVVKIDLTNNKVYVNDKEVSIDVPAMVINNRTLVPLRFLSEVLGKKVNYDEKTGDVDIEGENEDENEDENAVIENNSSNTTENEQQESINNESTSSQAENQTQTENQTTENSTTNPETNNTNNTETNNSTSPETTTETTGQ